jgi:uncharacterized protein
MTLLDQLMDAIKHGDEQKTADLINQDPALLQQAAPGSPTPLLLAVYYNNRQLSNLIVARGHALTIHEASAFGDEARVRALVELQPELANQPGPDGHYPLGLACFFLNTGVAEYLIQMGADVNARSQNNQQVTPLHAAAASRSASLAHLLLKNGADPNTRQNGGFTPLHSAAQNGQVDLVHLLLQHGAQRDVLSDDSKTPFDLAQDYKHPELLDLLRLDR